VTSSIERCAEQTLRVVEYAPDLFGALERIATHLGPDCNLAHRPFVDYYYASGESCRLFMIVGEDGKASATIGVESMPFEYDSRRIIVGCGSNFHSLRSGLGGYLFLHWCKRNPLSLVVGGSADTHRIIRRPGWRSFAGIRRYALNKPYLPSPREARWRVAAKWVMRRTRRTRRIPELAPRIARCIPAGLAVREEREYTHDLLPRRSPFRLRFAPQSDYLNWRYDTRLSFVRYRLFRILCNERTVGYVVLNDAPDRILVAQCDGEDVDLLAYGVLLSILHAGREDAEPRTVWLVSSHPRMQEIYARFGFTSDGPDWPFALGPLTRDVQLEPDTSSWLVNLDWGDNGLRDGFLDRRRQG
jgi:hypothetical protein